MGQKYTDTFKKDTSGIYTNRVSPVAGKYLSHRDQKQSKYPQAYHQELKAMEQPSIPALFLKGDPAQLQDKMVLYYMTTINLLSQQIHYQG